MPIEWIIGVLVTVILALAGALFMHVKECREVRATLATIVVQLTALSREVGDHDTGLRGSMHRLRQETREAIFRLERR